MRGVMQILLYSNRRSHKHSLICDLLDPLSHLHISGKVNILVLNRLHNVYDTVLSHSINYTMDTLNKLSSSQRLAADIRDL